MATEIERLCEIGVIPVVKIESAEQAVPLAEALREGGISCVEITFRTSAAEACIQRIRKSLPTMRTGAGTVLTIEQAHKAVNAGAEFIVSPGIEPRIVEWCGARGIPYLPGAATPSEVMVAVGAGLRVLKFFPAEALGGKTMIQALAPAFPGVKYVPTGGVTAKNMAEYLSLEMVAAVGGTWVATSALLTAHAYGEITRLAREAMGIVMSVRGQGGRA